MNVMLVSVAERTREIGVRVAVGATEEAIQLQFLGESVMLSLVGGAAGVLLGVVASMVVGRTLGWPMQMLAWRPIVARGGVLGRRRRVLRLLSGAQGVAARSDRGAPLRVTRRSLDSGRC